MHYALTTLTQIDDVQCHTETHHPVKKPVPCTNYSYYTIQQFKVCICSRAPDCSTVIHTWQEKNESTSQEAIIHGILAMTVSRFQVFEKLHALETEQGASQRSTWNQMLLPIYQASDPSAQFSQQLMGVTGDAFCVTWRLVFILLTINFNFPNVTPLTNLVEVTDQGLCYCNSNA